MERLAEEEWRLLAALRATRGHREPEMKHVDPSPPHLPISHSDCLKLLGVKVWYMVERSLKAILQRWCPVMYECTLRPRSPISGLLEDTCGPFQRLADPFKPFEILVDSTRGYSTAVGQPFKGKPAAVGLQPCTDQSPSIDRPDLC